jgi:hypothetical protein
VSPDPAAKESTMANRKQRRHPELLPQREGLVLIAMDAGRPTHEFFVSWDAALQYDHDHDGLILDHGARLLMQASPRLSEARCTMVREFLAIPAMANGKKPEWALFIDDDMEFEPDVPYRMIATAREEEVDLVGGLCFVGGRGSQDMSPTMYMLHDDPEQAKKLNMQRINLYPKGGRIQCDATGAAALLVRRRVLERMGEVFGNSPFPWFQDGSHLGTSFGEDVVFCIRARQLGFKLIVDTNIPFGHVKSRVLNEQVYEEWLAQRGEALKTAGVDTPEKLFDISGPIEHMSQPDVAEVTLPDPVDDDSELVAP